MSAEFFAAFAGALVATFGLSRLVLAILRGRLGGVARFLVAHGLSAGLACLIAAFGFGRDGVLNWENSGFYLAAQAIWLAVDLLAQRGRAARR